jgi:hypothetical protein
MYCGTQILVGESETFHKVQCRVCEGYGRVDVCRSCSGTGSCSWSTRSSGARNDIFTIGYSAHCVDGACSACGGTGRYALRGCPGCEGTGQCPRCLGTGKCAACHGVGYIPNLNGTENCKNCGGTGMMDPGSHTREGSNTPVGAPLLTGTCPGCGKKWNEELAICPHCGYIKRQCPGCGAAWVTGGMFCSKCGFGKASNEPRYR